MPRATNEPDDPIEDTRRLKSTSPPAATTTTANTAITRKPVAPRVPVVSRQNAWQANSLQVQQQGQQACPHCGASGEVGASGLGLGINNPTDGWTQKRISDLESEVKRLTEKASDAADKLADYEDELHRLKARRSSANPSDHSHQGNQELSSIQEAQEQHQLQEVSLQEINGSGPNEIQSPPPTQNVAPSRTASEKSHMHPPARQPMSLGRSLTTTRITNFLSARRASPSVLPSTPEPQSSISEPGNPPTQPDLNAQLAQEQNLRQAAEKKLNQTSLELEELSASLFQQANEMVATERKERVEGENKARERDKASAQRNKMLEEKVKKLEGRIKMLEQREADRGKRLERLEGAMKRAGRVRTLLQPPVASDIGSG